MKKILLIIILLGAAFFGYNYFNKSKDESLVEKLKSSSNVFETAIFHNSKFVNLQEHKINAGISISNPKIGKKNPFQPEQTQNIAQ